MADIKVTTICKYLKLHLFPVGSIVLKLKSPSSSAICLWSGAIQNTCRHSASRMMKKLPRITRKELVEELSKSKRQQLDIKMSAIHITRKACIVVKQDKIAILKKTHVVTCLEISVEHVRTPDSGVIFLG